MCFAAEGFLVLIPSHFLWLLPDWWSQAMSPMSPGTEMFEVQTKDREAHWRASLQAGCSAGDLGQDLRLPNWPDGSVFILSCASCSSPALPIVCCFTCLSELMSEGWVQAGWWDLILCSRRQQICCWGIALNGLIFYLDANASLRSCLDTRCWEKVVFVLSIVHLSPFYGFLKVFNAYQAGVGALKLSMKDVTVEKAENLVDQIQEVLTWELI